MTPTPLGAPEPTPTQLAPPQFAPPLPPPSLPAPATFSRAETFVRVGGLLALLLSLGVFYSWPAFFFIIGLLFFIFLHECGHFFTARWSGMKATQFFLGFGPRVWSFHRGEVEYGVKAIPLGAYVRIVGMSNLEEVEAVDEPRTYRQKSYPRRLLVATAGSLTHFISAIILMIGVLAGFGDVEPTRWKVREVVADSPAAAAGLEAGDKILVVEGTPVADFEQTTQILRAKPGQTISLSVEREGSVRDLTVTLAERVADPATGEKVGFLGIGQDGGSRVRQSLPTAVVNSVSTFGTLSKDTVVGIKQVFGPGGLREYVDTLAGRQENTDKRMLSPVGAARIGAAVCGDVASCLTLLAAVNVFVGIFNLFPLLPFDGGHVSIATYERLRSRKGRRYFADVRKMLPFSYVIMAAMLLMLFGNVYLDSTRSLGG